MRSIGSLVMAIAIVLPAAAQAQTQPLRPGFVDPMPVLERAAQAIGVDRLRCVTISGTLTPPGQDLPVPTGNPLVFAYQNGHAYTGQVGQQYYMDRQKDWPVGLLANYTRTMNWNDRAMVETFDRPPGHNPASWKYGTGWRGGTPAQQERRQTFAVKGLTGWSKDGEAGPAVAARPEDAEVWQLDLWMNPHGFLKAAKLPGANPVAAWRWEMPEMGRDGPTTELEKMTVVSITVLGKYRVDATINPRNMIQRLHTWIDSPVLGDFNFEQEFSDDSYVDVGGGIRFPTNWHHHQGLDDNFNGQTLSSGHNAFGATLKHVVANNCAALSVPATVAAAKFEEKIVSRPLADGVWEISGSTHNSVAITLKDYVVVVEAPIDEARSLGVIEEIERLAPNKPIRFVVNTHQHFDALGGLRTYSHIGATIITHNKNYEFYNRDVVNSVPRTVRPDMLSTLPPTEIAEGYNYETVRENYMLSDGQRDIRIFYVNPLNHVEGMLAVYLPKEKILIESDIFTTNPQGPKPDKDDMRALRTAVERLKFDVATVVPIQGPAVPWSDFLRAADAAGTAKD